MSTIHTNSLADFVEICARLVREGIAFEADAQYLVITLTGGF